MFFDSRLNAFDSIPGIAGMDLKSVGRREKTMKEEERNDGKITGNSEKEERSAFVCARHTIRRATEERRECLIIILHQPVYYYQFLRF